MTPELEEKIKREIDKVSEESIKHWDNLHFSMDLEDLRKYHKSRGYIEGLQRVLKLHHGVR